MNYAEAIAHSTLNAMDADPKVLVLGVGVSDQKGIFGTTKLANDKYPDRVIETPLSENMLTGACVGLTLEGYTPILVHARCDFTTLSVEHILNTAAKWGYSHGSSKNPTIIIRCIVGRGWGQGPQHSQNLAGMFSKMPGVNVLVPVYKDCARMEIQQAILNGGVNVIVESRRLYDTSMLYRGSLPERPCVSIYTVGDVFIEASIAANRLEEIGLIVNVIPIETSNSFTHFYNPGTPFVICENVPPGTGMISDKTLSFMCESGAIQGKVLNTPDCPCPTSSELESKWYISSNQIGEAVCAVWNLDPKYYGKSKEVESTFTGPF